MIEYEATLALLTLAELPSIGERRLLRMQAMARHRHITLADVAALPPAALSRDFGLPRRARARLEEDGFWHAAHCRALLSRLAATGAQLCSVGQAPYPQRWVQRADCAPPLAYLYGSLELLDQPALALLNSRGLDETVVSATLRVAHRGAVEGLSLVVGGMKSTHRIAAATARAAGAARLVVLDRGIFTAFAGQLGCDPFGLGPGRSRFDPRGTLVLSVCRPNDHGSPRSGRRRDELIAALGDIVVALSARPGGEVERICLRALDRGQCVLNWQGCSPTLIAAGAIAIDESELQRGLRRFLPDTA